MKLSEKERRIQERYMGRKAKRAKAVKKSVFAKGKRKEPWSWEVDYEE